jgi:hypothetical protein
MNNDDGAALDGYGPRLGSSPRGQPRSALEAGRAAGCTCNPEIRMVEANLFRIVHDYDCLIDFDEVTNDEGNTNE